MVTASINRIFLEQCDVRDLAVFMKLKSLYSNSCIYNFSYRSLSVKSGISINVLKRCVKSFVDLGWCLRHGGNLIFTKMKVLDCKTRRKIILNFNICKEDSYKDVLKSLKLMAIKFCQKRFEYVKKMSHDNMFPEKVGYEDYKKAKQLFRKGALTKSISESELFSISNRRVGELIGGSRSAASRLMNWGKNRGMLKIDPHIKMVKINVYYLDELRLRGYFMLYDGVAFKQYANYVTFF